ncbi:unnamed protein product, partial [Polarella glacialis]
DRGMRHACHWHLRIHRGSRRELLGCRLAPLSEVLLLGLRDLEFHHLVHDCSHSLWRALPLGLRLHFEARRAGGHVPAASHLCVRRVFRHQPASNGRCPAGYGQAQDCCVGVPHSLLRSDAPPWNRTCLPVSRRGRRGVALHPSRHCVGHGCLPYHP